MTIKTLIVENEDHIRLWWALKASTDKNLYSIELFEEKSILLKDLITQTNAPVERMTFRSDLVKTNMLLMHLLEQPEWELHENDPDFDKVYDSLLDLVESNTAFLVTHK